MSGFFVGVGHKRRSGWDLSWLCEVAMGILRSGAKVALMERRLAV